MGPKKDAQTTPSVKHQPEPRPELKMETKTSPTIDTLVKTSVNHQKASRTPAIVKPRPLATQQPIPTSVKVDQTKKSQPEIVQQKPTPTPAKPTLIKQQPNAAVPSLDKQQSTPTPSLVKQKPNATAPYLVKQQSNQTLPFAEQ